MEFNSSVSFERQAVAETRNPLGFPCSGELSLGFGWGRQWLGVRELHPKHEGASRKGGGLEEPCSRRAWVVPAETGILEGVLGW